MQTPARPLDLDIPLRQSVSAIVADIDGQMVALDIASGVCYGLNRVATRIWQILASPVTGRAICDALVSEFDVLQATCEEQTLDVLGDLLNAKLITESETA